MAGNTTQGQWYNADGLVVKFPQYYASPAQRVNNQRQVSTMGSIQTLEIDYDLSLIGAGNTSYTTDITNAGTLNGFNLGDPYLPANSSVLRCTMVATSAHTGGTSFTVGTYRQSGTAVAATGLITATEGVIANVAAAGQRIYGAGALVSTTAGTAGVGTSNVYVGITVTGTFTAGQGKIIIEYIDPGADTNTF